MVVWGAHSPPPLALRARLRILRQRAAPARQEHSVRLERLPAPRALRVRTVAYARLIAHPVPQDRTG